ncbi:plasmid recombination protein [Thomasclavelia cocleata]|uniref:plasmid recombination protein n=1 Tax=Thomasclavelia cocleata TaxID=69824 RepID=UPI0025AA3156|nr:plasmid recombination protein [Thomasclavelia cocleata]
MIQRSISGMVGKGSLTHNRRAFKAKNVKEDYTQYNIEYCNENIERVYHELFDEAQERYNAKQTRSDRRIDNYYDKIRTGKQEKLFHEVIFQIGNKEDMNTQSEYGELAKKILDKFMKGFQKRNPNLRVFAAHLHMDEETPHLHIDFVPFVTGSKRGMDTRVSLKQALAEQGFQGGTKRETEWNQWITAEKQELSEIMEQYEVAWKHLGTNRKHLDVLEFKKQEREKEVVELTTRKKEMDQVVQEMQETIMDKTEELKSLQGKKEKMEKELLKLTFNKKTVEKNISMIREDEAWQLPEAAVWMTAKNYQEKKALPLIEKIKETLVSALIENVRLNGLLDKMKKRNEHLQKQVQYLDQHLERMKKENVDFRKEIVMFHQIKSELGEEEIKRIVEHQKERGVLKMVKISQKKRDITL